MRIVAFYLLKWNEKGSFMINITHSLEFINFFKRYFFKEYLNFGSRTAVTRMKPGDKTFVEDKEEKDFKSYVEIQKNGLAVVIISDQEYPQSVIPIISRQIVQEFYNVYNQKQFEEINCDVNWPINALEEMIKKYQNPNEVDKVFKLQNDLQEVHKIMTKNLDEILRRGEVLETLMAKSKDVSTLSLNFYKKAREANKKCCSLY